jgi:hypothetical protein
VRYRSSSGAGGETGHATFTLGEHRQPIGGVVGGRGARTAEARARSRGRARRGWPASAMLSLVSLALSAAADRRLAKNQPRAQVSGAGGFFCPVRRWKAATANY